MNAPSISRVLGVLRQEAMLAISIVVMAVAIVAALLAPYLGLPAPEQMTTAAYLPPSWAHPFGTDNFGRDVLARVVWGTRLALLIALGSSAISTIVGIVLGSVSGYFGGWLDGIMSRLFDIFLLIPVFFLVLLIVALFGSNVMFIMFAIAATTWPRSARIMRSQVLTLKSRTYVEASLGAGASHWSVLFRHVVPNGLPPVITDATLLMGLAVLTEAGLSFLGLGDQNTVSWGRMIFEGQAQLRIAPWISAFPGLAMLVLVAALNFLGDGLNRLINPQARPRQAAIARPAPLPVTDSQPVRDVSPGDEEAILSVDNLRMHFQLGDRWVRAVDGISLSVPKGGSLGIVGESGCGKSSLGQALMQVLPPNGRVLSGRIWFDGKLVMDADHPALGTFDMVRWKRMSMIFQSAMSALNPVLTVRRQLREAYRLHLPDAPWNDADRRIDEILDIVGVPRSRVDSFPHELSGGMRQRMMIALGLLLKPELIIADEPTTALDVLVQDQIMGEIGELRRRMNLAMILISHDMGTVAESCDRVAVMYAGQIIEQASSQAIFETPSHPYTQALIEALPRLRGERGDLTALPGEPFVPIGEVQGCRFAPRCRHATTLCHEVAPNAVSLGSEHFSVCHYADTPSFVAMSKKVRS